jgi:hypothetical protein
MKAIFEAIVNAVVHRDYSKSGSKIRVDYSSFSSCKDLAGKIVNCNSSSFI